MPTSPIVAKHPRGANASRHRLRGATFYMYEGDALDHGWMRSCPGFAEWTTGGRMQNTAENGAHAVFSHTAASRVRNPEHADLFFVPIFPYLSQKLDRCDGQHGNRTHEQRSPRA